VSPKFRLVQVSAGTATTHLLYDGDALVAEYNGAGTQLRRYVHGPGVDEPLVWYEGNPRRYFYADERGSITAANQAYYGPLFANRYDEYGHLEEPMDFGAMRANAGAVGWKPPDGRLTGGRGWRFCADFDGWRSCQAQLRVTRAQVAPRAISGAGSCRRGWPCRSWSGRGRCRWCG